MKKTFTLLLIAACTNSFAQKLDSLTIEKIMRDPKWIGVAPSNIRWDDDSRKIYFNWNPQNDFKDALYTISTGNTDPEKVTLDEKRAIVPNNGEWNKKHTKKVYIKNGDIYLENVNSGDITQLTSTGDRESNPSFSGDERKVLFMRGNNLYALKLNGSELLQLTNFVKTATKKDDDGSDDTQQAKWLKQQQLELFDIIKVKDKDDKLATAERKSLQSGKMKELVTGDKDVDNVEISPDGRYITYRLIKSADEKTVIVPDYVTASGYTEDIPNRTKVGGPQSTAESFIYDTKRDSVYKIVTKNIPGIKDLPDYVKDYPDELAERTKLT